ncbi:phage tail protein [Chitinophaga flava]|uniref:Phage tail protein n=1 Tax=Chitinophaga flava TaxID=2259036 RepID=A0A365XU73_9BACT|nr:tail fiber protein [Chitinophaga flava]RBL89912.1 phage tail protein [Chitinophaga flava]
MQPFIGEIRIFAGNFEPAGWAFCWGQLLNISDNDPLFRLIGNTYGGDGISTFALPDLRGRVPLHMGTLGNETYTIGDSGGLEKVTITTNQLPAHKHTIAGNVYMPTLGENPGKLLSPDNNYTAITSGQQVYSTNPHPTNHMAPLKVSPRVANTAPTPNTFMQVEYGGGGQPKENMQPYTAVNYIISLYGIFPYPF